MDGFLNVAKPKGCTSRDVVNRIQRLVRPHKVGHAGTLDPLASGVLVVAVGQATKLVERIQQTAKSYQGEFLLGRSSDTEDTEGEVIEVANPHEPSEADLRVACQRMVGEISQMPPQYSALKIRGKRAYDLARRGIKAELKPRLVRIDSCELVWYEYPRFELGIICGSGTYVRSLGRDIADSLGTSAVMSELSRTAVGPFRLADAICLDTMDLPSADPSALVPLCYPLSVAVADLYRLDLTEEEAASLGHGRRVANRFGDSWETAAAFAPDGRLAAIVACSDANQVRPLRNFPCNPQ